MKLTTPHDRSRRPVRTGHLVWLSCVLLMTFGTGCATVRPYEKEHLADTIMLSPRDAKEAARELKWLEAREGSNGGTGGAGGGCACK